MTSSDRPTSEQPDKAMPNNGQPMSVPKPPPSAMAKTAVADKSQAEKTGDEVEGQPLPHHLHRSAQWTILACVVFSYLVFWFAGSKLAIPAERGFSGSLLGQPGMKPVLGLVAAAVLLLVVTVNVGFVAGRIWLFAGPLAAAAGLTAWSFRGGPSYYSLIGSDPASASTRVFLWLAFESLLLGAAMAGVWLLLYRKYTPPLARDEKPFSLIPSRDAIQVILTQTVLIGICVLLLVPTGEKNQAVFGVLAASFIGTAITRHFHNNRLPGQWCWAGPILVAIVGYLAFWILGDSRQAVETGHLTGLFAPLARPLPLDYAGAGVVGALMGLAMTTTEWEALGSQATPQPAEQEPAKT